MRILKKDTIDDLEKEIIFKLWNEEYPASIVYNSIDQLDHYLNELSDVKHHFLLDKKNIIGWAITFTRDNERWFAIIVDNAFHGKGSGTFLLNHLKENETILNGWIIEDAGYLKADGSVYHSPSTFYLKNDFNILHNNRLETPEMKAVKIHWKQS